MMDPFVLLPNFFILGAAKAGTTTLNEVLKQHPEIYLPFNKEPMFFSHDGFFARGVDWYTRTFFRKAGGYPARGEATPHYLYWSEKVAPRICHIYGDRPPRLIVILRDPVVRAYSWYWNMVREGREELPFAAALEQEPRRLEENRQTLEHNGHMTYGYFRGGCYASLLKPYLELFPREVFHFLLQEDLDRDFPSAFQAVASYLGVEATFPFQPVKRNQAAAARSLPVQKVLRQDSFFKNRVKKILPPRLRHALMNLLLPLNSRQQAYPPMDAGIERMLRERFSGEVLCLQQIIDRDLSTWLPT